MSTGPKSVGRFRLWAVAALLGAAAFLIVVVGTAVLRDAQDPAAHVLIWPQDVGLDDSLTSGPMTPTPAYATVEFDAETGCFFEDPERTTVIIWQEGTSAPAPGVVATSSGALIEAPATITAQQVARVTVWDLKDRYPALSTCLTKDTTLAAFVVGLMEGTGPG